MKPIRSSAAMAYRNNPEPYLPSELELVFDSIWKQFGRRNWEIWSKSNSRLGSLPHNLIEQRGERCRQFAPVRNRVFSA